MALDTNPYLGRQNPYLQGNIDAAQGDLVRSYNMTAQPAFNAAMVKSGSFGNEGVQQMNENSQRNLQSSLGQVSNDMRMKDYNQQQDMYRWDQGFDRDIYNDAFMQNNTNLQTGIGLLGTMNQYNQQNLQNGTTAQNTPLNYYQQFSNIANGLGQGYGTSTSTASGGGSSPITSALGGAQLGSSLWNRYSGSVNNTGNNWASGDSYGGTDYGAAAGGDYGQFF